MLGNNMFAYCLNNPVNRIDFYGDISLWYYLIIDHDMGFIHRAVQAHINATHGWALKTELFLTGLGRADIVYESKGYVWEVKHAGADPAARTAIAKQQATGYINGNGITALGPAQTFNGKFHISCFGQLYEVNYHTPQDGVVLYTVKEVKSQSQSNPEFVYVPKSNQNKEMLPSLGDTCAIAGPIIVPLSISGGGYYMPFSRFANHFV